MSALVEAPLGKVEVAAGNVREEVWVGLDLERVVEVTVWKAGHLARDGQ